MKCAPILLVLLYLVMSARAQNEKGDVEISAGIGIFSDVDVFTFTDHLFYFSTNPGVRPTSASGPYFVSTRYYIGKRIALGVSGGAETINGESVSGQNSMPYTPYTYTTHYYTVGIDFTFIYKKFRMVQMYSTAGIGAAYFHTSGSYAWGASFPADKENNKISGTFTNAYVSPIGFRFGNDLACFVQLGFGYSGLFSTGIAYRLKTGSNYR